MALNNLTRIGNSGFGTDTSINTTGIVTAASFSGDGSGLTGITALGSGVVVQEEGSNVGTAQTINFIGTGVTATFSGGIASVEIATSGGGGGGGLSDVVSDTTPQLGGNLDLNSNNITGTGDINITGDATFSGDLDVDGHVDLDNVSIAGVSTFNAVRIGDGGDQSTNNLFFGADGDLAIYHTGVHAFMENSTGNLYLRSSAGTSINIEPAAGAAGIIANAGGDVELYYNNSKKFETTNTGAIVTGTLVATATTATNVTVANEASDTECFVMFGVNATGDNAPKSSSSLKYNSSTGGLTAGSFIGDGSGLTGITASGSGVIVRDGGSLVGTAGTIDFGSNVSVSPISAGVVTVTASAGSIPGISTAQTTELTNLTVAGVTTFTGAIDANGDLDVDGHTDLDNLNVAGVSTFSSTVYIPNSLYLNGPGNQSDLYIGSSNQVKLDHNGSSAFWTNTTGYSYIRGADGFIVQKEGGGYDDIIKGIADGAVELYYDDVKKFETTNTGAVVTGILTATTFSGSGASLTNLPAANLTGTLPAISGANLTNLDASDLASGTIPDARFPATLPAISGANLTNLPASGISTAFTNVQATWSVGGDTSGYTFTGPGQDGAEQNPDIYLVRGQRYRFINTTGSGHPFEIRLSNGGSAYTDGITGSTSGTQDFNVQHDAPVRLYYQCTIHSGMIGNIYIVGGSDWRMTDVTAAQTPEIFTNLNVGIGTDNPQEKLHVLGTSDFIVDTDSAAVRVGSYGEFDFALVTGRNTPSNSSRFYIESGDGEAIRIDSNGLIGIKNGDPLYPMHFKNAMASTPSYIHMEVTGTNTVGGGGGIQFDTSASNNTSNNGLYLATIHGERSASDNGSNTLIFKTTKAGVAGDDGNTHSPKTRMTIDEDGDVNISDGNLVVASGHGIDFSATANGTTSSSELFDDYEEGAWTPSITLGGGSTGMTYSRQEGHYTKIGRQVFAQFRITLTAKGSSTGQLRINGLPFTAANVFTSTGIDGQVHIAHDNGFNAGNVSNNAVAGYVEGATTYLLLTTRNTNANLETMSSSYIDSDLSISGTVIFYA